ncbi:MAG: class I SAM-dependent methyltransferase [Actinomycetota bacterium]|nr:class I SAM-dependent methyltransferase [Actinomycetota bacterium]
MAKARYDGQTEWYDSVTRAGMFARARNFVVQLLGPGPGRCLDLGCGTGRAIPALSRAGWSVVGTDISGDQLEAARAHADSDVELVRADAHALPFEDAEFDAVVSILTHTDLDYVERAFAEASRVLRPGGAFVYLGVHPCFGSPFVKRGEGPAPVLHPGYRRAGWHRLPPDPAGTQIRARVGINHVTLAGLLNAIVGSGLAISHVEEPGDDDPPLFLAVCARPEASPGTARTRSVRGAP